MIRTVVALLPAGSRPLLGAQIALTVLGHVLRAVGAVSLIPLVEALFTGDDRAAWLWLAVLAAATVLGWVVDVAAARRAYEIGFAMLGSGQPAVADRIARVRLGWFTPENKLTTRQAVAATSHDLVGVIIYLVSPVIGAFVLPVAVAGALFAVSWQLGLAALVGVPILLGAFLASGRLSRDADRAASESVAEVTERLVEFARTQQALRAARRVDPARSQVGAALDAQHGAIRRLVLLQLPGQLIFSLASQLALIGLAGTTAWLAVRGEMTAPAAIAVVVVIARYLEGFTVLAELSPGLEGAAGALRRIREVLDAPTLPDGGDLSAPVAPPRIELRSVSFAYDQPADAAGEGEGAGAAALPDVLTDFSLTLEPGTTTAIVGASGSGKSTVLSLVAGLQQPTGGEILVDGTPADRLSADARAGLVTMILQEPYLFDATIEENVRVGSPGASDDRRDEVAGLARVTPILDRLPEGWAARVGSGGGNLSGGEKQRVSIARALLKPAPVLLIDEATSALDAENERAVVDALAADPTPRTRVVVAHRRASVSAADRVVVLDQGRIVEDGTIPELLEKDGAFARFWREPDAADRWHLSPTGPHPEA
jgi:ATP-binding cassette subfamily B protein IrtB